jgi:hypothetical protein
MNTDYYQWCTWCSAPAVAHTTLATGDYVPVCRPHLDVLERMSQREQVAYGEN